MRLLVTRPLPDAMETAAKVRGLGHEAMVQPLMTIVLAPPPRDVAAPAAIVITSGNALRALETWPRVADWRQAPMFVTGDATARAAAALGFTDVRPGGGDAASLAETVREALPAAAGAVLYPAARERTGRLSEELIAAGYEVRLVEAYRAAPVAQLDGPVRAALANGALDGVLLYSRRTAEAFRALATRAGIADRLGALTYYVLAEPIGAALAGTEAEIRWPDRPDEASLLGLIGPPG